jgi:hypothetical protein
LSKFIRQKSPKNIILEGLKFLAQRPIFVTRLAEIFCQEFATLGDAAVGAGLLARSHILRVRINILKRFFFDIKIHSILYPIIEKNFKNVILKGFKLNL